MKNLGWVLEGILERHPAARRRGQVETASAIPLEIPPPKLPPKLSPKEVQVSQAKREERLAQYQQIVALCKQGLSQAAIAERVGVASSTISRWLTHGTFPEQQPRPRKTRLDPYLKEVARRWEAGCHNIAQLHRELVAVGAL
jgi:hypothetical protein